METEITYKQKQNKQPASKSQFLTTVYLQSSTLAKQQRTPTFTGSIWRCQTINAPPTPTPKLCLFLAISCYTSVMIILLTADFYSWYLTDLTFKLPCSWTVQSNLLLKSFCWAFGPTTAKPEITRLREVVVHNGLWSSSSHRLLAVHVIQMPCLKHTIRPKQSLWLKITVLCFPRHHQWQRFEHKLCLVSRHSIKPPLRAQCLFTEMCVNNSNVCSPFILFILWINQ